MPLKNISTLRRNLTRMTKHTFPRTDEQSENLKVGIRSRIKRQRKILKVMKTKHLENFPEKGVLDSDDEAWPFLKGL